MNKYTELEIKQNVARVKGFMKNGIDVVVMPVRDEEHKDDLELQMSRSLMLISSDLDKEDEK